MKLTKKLISLLLAAAILISGVGPGTEAFASAESRRGNVTGSADGVINSEDLEYLRNFLLGVPGYTYNERMHIAVGNNPTGVEAVDAANISMADLTHLRYHLLGLPGFSLDGLSTETGIKVAGLDYPDEVLPEAAVLSSQEVARFMSLGFATNLVALDIFHRPADVAADPNENRPELGFRGPIDLAAGTITALPGTAVADVEMLIESLDGSRQSRVYRRGGASGAVLTGRQMLLNGDVMIVRSSDGSASRTYTFIIETTLQGLNGMTSAYTNDRFQPRRQFVSFAATGNGSDNARAGDRPRFLFGEMYQNTTSTAAAVGSFIEFNLRRMPAGEYIVEYNYWQSNDRPILSLLVGHGGGQAADTGLRYNLNLTAATNIGGINYAVSPTPASMLLHGANAANGRVIRPDTPITLAEGENTLRFEISTAGAAQINFNYIRLIPVSFEGDESPVGDTAIESPGGVNQTAGQPFGLLIEYAKNPNGSLIHGMRNVTITSNNEINPGVGDTTPGVREVFNGPLEFVAGRASVEVTLYHAAHLEAAKRHVLTTTITGSTGTLSTNVDLNPLLFSRFQYISNFDRDEMFFAREYMHYLAKWLNFDNRSSTDFDSPTNGVGTGRTGHLGIRELFFIDIPEGHMPFKLEPEKTVTRGEFYGALVHSAYAHSRVPNVNLPPAVPEAAWSTALSGQHTHVIRGAQRLSLLGIISDNPATVATTINDTITMEEAYLVAGQLLLKETNFKHANDYASGDANNPPFTHGIAGRSWADIMGGLSDADIAMPWLDAKAASAGNAELKAALDVLYHSRTIQRVYDEEQAEELNRQDLLNLGLGDTMNRGELLKLTMRLIDNVGSRREAASVLDQQATYRSTYPHLANIEMRPMDPNLYTIDGFPQGMIIHNNVMYVTSNINHEDRSRGSSGNIGNTAHRSYLAAFDARTHEFLRYYNMDDTYDITPNVFTRMDGKELIVLRSHLTQTLRAFYTLDDDPVTNFSIPAEMVWQSSAPLPLGNNVAFGISHYTIPLDIANPGNLPHGLQPGETILYQASVNRLHAFSLEDGRFLWRVPVSAFTRTINPAVDQERGIVFTSDAASIGAFNAITGETLHVIPHPWTSPQLSFNTDNQWNVVLAEHEGQQYIISHFYRAMEYGSGIAVHQFNGDNTAGSLVPVWHSSATLSTSKKFGITYGNGMIFVGGGDHWQANGYINTASEHSTGKQPWKSVTAFCVATGATGLSTDGATWLKSGDNGWFTDLSMFDVISMQQSIFIEPFVPTQDDIDAGYVAHDGYVIIQTDSNRQGRPFLVFVLCAKTGDVLRYYEQIRNPSNACGLPAFSGGKLFVADLASFTTLVIDIGEGDYENWSGAYGCSQTNRFSAPGNTLKRLH